MPSSLNSGVVKPKEESWQLDSSGLFFSSPTADSHGGILLGTTTKAAGNMADETERTRLLRRLDVDARKLALSYQVHGSDIHLIRHSKDIPVSRIHGLDGWVASHDASAVLGVFTADCMPVFLLHKERALGALVHAGWRGLYKGIVEKAAATLRDECVARPGELKAVIGPHIRSCCYEIKEDVLPFFGEAFINDREGKKHLDLASCAATKLEAVGISEVTVADVCTKCSPPSLFHSYRRGDKGSLLSLLSFL